MDPGHRQKLEDALPKLSVWPGYSARDLQDAADSAAVPSIVLVIEQAETASMTQFIVEQIEFAAIALFPSWLKEAGGIETPGGAGREALALLAKAAAARTDLFGPYLLAIADAGLCKSPHSLSGKFASQTVLRECYKLLCRAYETERVALILDLGDARDNEVLIAAQEAGLFIAAQDAFLVWLTGTYVAQLSRLPVQAQGRPEASEDRRNRPPPPLVQITPLAGRPNPLSKTETRLEIVLSRHTWASGRAWNATWSNSALNNPIRVDLLWEAERLVVELDGYDHLVPEKYANDRARDRALQFAGFTVLRFTNQEIADDISRIASEIERFLTQAKA